MTDIRVFKFGGASVKDAAGVQNMCSILRKYSNENLVVVVSAMGKTTNALEKVCNSFFSGNAASEALLEEIKIAHFTIVRELFPGGNPHLENELENIFTEIYWAIEEDQIKSYDFEYDQIVSQGEMLSTRIVAAWLAHQGLNVQLKDARDLIQTDNRYREATVDWELSSQRIKDTLVFNDQHNSLYLTQGFIGGTSENFTTTLGREGSDYTAAILAYALDARDVVVWKDVPGVLDGDPRELEHTELIPELSYFDAIELAYYGASVIHPKTIKPLQNKHIPLRVKSFVDPDQPGTLIYDDQQQNRYSSVIFKKNQILLSVSTRDFSFIVEENLQDLFELFNKHHIKVNLMQQAALTFSVCIGADPERFEALTQELNLRYKIKYNIDCELITIRHYKEPLPDWAFQRGNILLEQRSRQTLQIVVKNNTQ
jgi:aspartate kinase